MKGRDDARLSRSNRMDKRLDHREAEEEWSDVVGDQIRCFLLRHAGWAGSHREEAPGLPGGLSAGRFVQVVTLAAEWFWVNGQGTRRFPGGEGCSPPPRRTRAGPSADMSTAASDWLLAEDATGSAHSLGRRRHPVLGRIRPFSLWSCNSVRLFCEPDVLGCPVDY
jgi:hypothetical protein